MLLAQADVLRNLQSLRQPPLPPDHPILTYVRNIESLYLNGAQQYELCKKLQELRQHYILNTELDYLLRKLSAIIQAQPTPEAAQQLLDLVSLTNALPPEPASRLTTTTNTPFTQASTPQEGKTTPELTDEIVTRLSERLSEVAVSRITPPEDHDAIQYVLTVLQPVPLAFAEDAHTIAKYLLCLDYTQRCCLQADDSGMDVSCQARDWGRLFAALTQHYLDCDLAPRSSLGTQMLIQLTTLLQHHLLLNPATVNDATKWGIFTAIGRIYQRYQSPETGRIHKAIADLPVQQFLAYCAAGTAAQATPLLPALAILESGIILPETTPYFLSSAIAKLQHLSRENLRTQAIALPADFTTHEAITLFTQPLLFHRDEATQAVDETPLLSLLAHRNWDSLHTYRFEPTRDAILIYYPYTFALSHAFQFLIQDYTQKIDNRPAWKSFFAQHENKRAILMEIQRMLQAILTTMQHALSENPAVSYIHIPAEITHYITHLNQSQHWTMSLCELSRTTFPDKALTDHKFDAVIARWNQWIAAIYRIRRVDLPQKIAELQPTSSNESRI
ncbi:MAG: hypothetical protein A3J38_10425 [Gammaproteobacteria bacterium RIFCSPHIGHO2_12_FULL_45_9]|nr:MAG: hypothetical protein A3J38_10425 [Gammaproteobacteria bacterium RIFCSPHIGHO2_12_FULL_45_9]